MPTFTQVCLRPGRYHVGNGAFRDLTAEQLRSFAAGTQAVLSAGHGVPVILEHPAPGSADGAPVQFDAAHDRKAAQVRHGVGWLKSVRCGDDGAMLHEIEVTDSEAARRVKEGSIRFTSPELRPAWTDGQGREFRNVISHVAFTHKPRAADQSQLALAAAGAAAGGEIAQFSLADWSEPVQFADDDESSDAANGGEPVAKNANPDAPSGGGDEQQFQAVLLRLREQCGIDLPSDCTLDTFQRDLLTALKTIKAVEDKQAAEEREEAAEETDENPDLVEQQPQVQFSLTDIDDGKVPKLLARVMQAEQVNFETTVARLPPSLRKRLQEECGPLQFSADGEVTNRVPLPRLLLLLQEHATALGAIEAQADQFSLAEPDGGEAWYAKPGADLSPEEAERHAADFAQRNPRMCRK